MFIDTMVDPKNAIYPAAGNFHRRQAHKTTLTRFLFEYGRRADLENAFDYAVWLEICVEVRRELGWAIYEEPVTPRRPKPATPKRA